MRAGSRIVVAIAAAASALLAGCSAEGAAEGEVDEGGPAEGTGLVATGLAASPDVVATDTLFLALPARLNTTSPANLTILATLSGALAQSAAWNTTFNGTGLLTTARLVLWLDLQNSAVQTGIGGDPGCSAALTLTFVANNTTVVQPGGCASLGTGHVPPGEHVVELSTPLTAAGPEGLRIAPGDQVTIAVAFGFVLPQGVGYVLGGGEHPSNLRLTGLVEPRVPAPRP